MWVGPPLASTLRRVLLRIESGEVLTDRTPWFGWSGPGGAGLLEVEWSAGRWVSRWDGDGALCWFLSRGPAAPAELWLRIDWMPVVNVHHFDRL